jgi:hypothetical protein
MSATVTVESNMKEFNALFARYLLFTSKLPEEALEKKGRDISIKLYQGFYAHKWRGSRKGRGIAWRELKQRSKLNPRKGIRLRPQSQPSPKAPDTHMVYRKVAGASGKTRKLLTVRKTSEHQKKVFSELSRRQGGIGFLAASFLWFRRRSNQQRGTFYIRNRTSRPLGYVDRGPGYFQIVGLVDGLAEVDLRYQVVAGAISTARDDMVKYFNDRHLERYRRIFGEDPR